MLEIILVWISCDSPFEHGWNLKPLLRTIGALTTKTLADYGSKLVSKI